MTTIQPQTIHRANSNLLERQIRIDLIGCGGNGAQMLTGLARLHLALQAVGHPGGLYVVAHDGDTVSESNVARQLFSPSDIGLNKATLLVHRLNCFYGLNWQANPTMWTKLSTTDSHIVISCVDTAAARRSIHNQIAARYHPEVLYWLDLGNRQQDGQVILGESRLENKGPKKKTRQKPNPRLSLVTEVFPELLDASIPEDDAPSCSLAEALDRQDLYINDHISRWALHLLWCLIRKGQIEHHGYFVNLEDGCVRPLPIPL